MSLKLYFGPGACSFVPHTLLEATGAAFEPVMVKLHKGEQYGDEYRALNPRGQVPVLVDGSEVITQIVAIVTYLDAKFPEQQFLPREPLARARVMETLAWMNNTVHTTFTHIFMPHKFLASDAGKAELKAFNTELYAKLMGEMDAIAQKAKSRGWAWLGGEHFGPLDAYLLTLMRWGSIAGINPEGFAAAWTHVQKVAAHAPVARAMERERLQLNLYKPA